MTKPKIEIKHVPIGEINPAEYNPRAISDHAFKGLVESLKKFGLVDPLIVNKTTGNLVGGHQRLKAAHSLGLEMVPVVEVEITEKQERALNVSLNNPNISGFFTDDLAAMLDELKFDFGEEYLKDLNLHELLPPAQWDDDVSSINSNLDAISATIKISCEQEEKNLIKDLVREKIKEAGFEGVTVE